MGFRMRMRLHISRLRIMYNRGPGVTTSFNKSGQSSNLGSDDHNEGGRKRQHARGLNNQAELSWALRRTSGSTLKKKVHRALIMSKMQQISSRSYRKLKECVDGLPNSMLYLLVPGVFINHGPLHFVNTKTSFSKMGLTCHLAIINSGSPHDGSTISSDNLDRMFKYAELWTQPIQMLELIMSPTSESFGHGVFKQLGT